MNAAILSGVYTLITKFEEKRLIQTISSVRKDIPGAEQFHESLGSAVAHENIF